jgi:PAS domain S-box-containing protein
MRDSDPQQEFDTWFVRYADGLIRVRPEIDDHKRLPSIYIRASASLSPEMRRQVVAAFRLLREWGPAMTLRYYSAYIDLPGISLIMYSPSVNWGKEADTSTNNFDYPPVQNSAPDKNPQRKSLWTEVYFDDKANIWMLSIITPMDQSRWVGTASQDIAVDDLILRTTNDYAPGTYNLVFDTQGRLVAHPKLMENIRKSAGNLDVKSLGDAQLQGFWEVVSKTATDGEVRQSPDGQNYLGISRIQGPNWYFVTVYPKALLERHGLDSAQAILIGGALGLVLELLLLAWIIRKQVAEPLKALTSAVQSISDGDMHVQIQGGRADELGHLGSSFMHMTEKLRARDALLTRSEAFKDTLLQTIPDVVFVKDPQGAFLAANRAFEGVYGQSVAQIYGKTDFDFLPHDRALYFADRDAEAMHKGTPTVSESWQHNLQTGRTSLYETIKTPIRGPDGATIGLLGIGRDITARHEAEVALQRMNQELEQRVHHRTDELQQANAELTTALDILKQTQKELIQGEKLASLGRMVAGLAHELNTPLGNALTIGSTLADHVRDSKAALDNNQLKKSELTAFFQNSADAVEVLERALHQANDLIANFKQVSADQLSDRRRVFDLETTVKEIVSTLLPNLRATPFQIEVRVPAGIAVDSYPGYLTQVISNLVTNAVVHAFDGMARGTVVIEGFDRGDLVELWVTDDGNGIPEEIRSRIFDPFFTTRMGRGGTGLGLSIVHGVMTQGLGGRIQVDYGLTPGTRFVIDFPKRDDRPANASVHA